MLKKDFWYDLPKELIAQEPADPRDAARLMVLDRKNDKILHSVFHELPHYLEKGDLLVVNNSKVLPARLMGTKMPTGAVCELLLLRQVKGDTWECLARPGKRMQPGTKVEFGDGSLTAVVDETLPDGNKYVTFTYDTETLYEKLDEFGKMPLPPYITKQLEDQSQYQTVYAKELGSAAAPTAGLHFTPQLMDTIRGAKPSRLSMISAASSSTHSTQKPRDSIFKRVCFCISSRLSRLKNSFMFIAHSSQNSSSNVLPSTLQMLRQRLMVGLYSPFSIALMVWRDTPTTAARSAWVISSAARAAFSFRFFAIAFVSFPLAVTLL